VIKLIVRTVTNRNSNRAKIANILFYRKMTENGRQITSAYQQ